MLLKGHLRIKYHSQYVKATSDSHEHSFTKSLGTSLPETVIFGKNLKNQWKRFMTTIVPMAYILISKLIWWLSRNGQTKCWHNSVYGDLTCAKYGRFCIFTRFQVLVHIPMVIVVRCSENLFALPSLFLRIWGVARCEWLSLYFKFSNHKIWKSTRMSPFPKCISLSFTLKNS